MAQGKVTAATPHGCHDRPPFRPFYLSKAGFSANGRQLFKRTAHVLSTECVTGRITNDPRCTACKWKGENMTLAVMNLSKDPAALEVEGVAVVVVTREFDGSGWGWKHTGGRWASLGCLFPDAREALRDAAKVLRLRVVDTVEQCSS
jgi:hypothetical protein